MKNKNNFVFYPTIDNKNFYEKIYSKKEFHNSIIPIETRTAEDVCSMKKEFSLMPQQKFLRNFISIDTPYNGILIFHGVGVGKTCTAISIAEGFKEMMKIYNKKALVILPKNVRDGFKKEIYNIDKETDDPEMSFQCTGMEYNILGEYKYLTKEQRQKKIQQLIKSNYKFLGYKQFANEVQRLTGWKDGKESSFTDNMKKLIEKEYSNRVIIIDEIHNIKHSSKETRFVPPYLKAVIKYGKNIKLILMSATPMYNKSTEFIYILNLLLLNDKRKTLQISDVFNQNGSFKKGGKELLTEKVKGYISYLRGERPPAFPIKLFPKEADIPNIKYDLLGAELPKEKRIKFVKIIECEMGPYQYGYYKEQMNKIIESKKINSIDEIEGMLDGDEETENSVEINIKNNNTNTNTNNFEEIKESEEIKNGDADEEAEMEDEVVEENKILKKKPRNFGFTLFRSLLQISDIVFPTSNGPAYGNAGFISKSLAKGALIETRKKLHDLKKKAVTFSYGDNAILNKGTKEEVPFLDKSVLANYSNKFLKAFEAIRDAKGICYVYSEFKKAGVIPFALVLEQNGFERYTVKGETQLLDYTPNKLGGGGKRPRICYKCGKGIIDPVHKKGHKDYHKWMVAKYVVITGSNDSLTHIDIGKVSEVISSNTNQYGEEVKVIIGTRVAGEGVNFKRIRQVHILEPWYNLSRLEQVIGRAIRYCSHITLPENERNVDIFQYASVVPRSSNKKLNETESIDLNHYRVSEMKDIFIKDVENILKVNAIDCSLNKNSNIITKNNTVNLIDSRGESIKYTYGDKPNSAACGYKDDCNFKCAWEPPKSGIKVNLDTYNIKYAKSNIDIAKKLIKRMFRIGYNYKLEDIINYVESEIKDIDKLYIYKALDDILNSKYEIVFDKYNQEGSIIYKGGYYIYQPTEIDDLKIPIYYRSHPVQIKKKFIRLDDKPDLESKNNKNDNKNKVKDILGDFVGKMIDLESEMAVLIKENNISNSGMLIVEMLFERLLFEDKMSFLKLIIKNVIENKVEDTEYMSSILDYIDRYIIRQGDIKKSSKNPDKIIGFMIENKYLCYEKDWKNCNVDVIQLIKFRKKKDVKKYNFSQIYGFVEKSNKNIFQFKIINKNKEKSALTLDYKSSKRSKIKGRACYTEKIEDQITLANDLNINIGDVINKTRLCNIIELFLRHNNMILFNGEKWFKTYDDVDGSNEEDV
jgi:hypothetical protein